MYTILIDNIQIPDDDIMDIDMPTKDMVNQEFKLESTSINITLNNADPTKYDPDNTSSIFNANWYNMSCVVMDQDTDFIIFRGKIKQREKQKTASKNIIKLKIDSLLKDILKTKIITSLGKTSNVTPSEIIYDILTTHCNVPINQINALSFQIAQDLQTGNSAYLYLDYTEDNAADAGKLINDIMKMTNSHLYTVNNIFHYYQWTPYNQSQIGSLIQNKDIINGTYTHGSDEKTIYNDYRLLYADGTVKTITTTTTGHDITTTERTYLNDSISIHGTLLFASHEDSESDVIADYKMLYKSLISAQYYGRSIFQRFYAVQETVSLSITLDKYIKDSIALLQQIDLTNEDYSREPFRIYGTEFKKKDRSVNLIGQWLDKPHLLGTALRDSTPPDPIEILYAYVSGSGKMVLSFTPSHDANLLYYNFYISKDGIEWFKIFPFIGQSPIKMNHNIFFPQNDINYYEFQNLELDTYYYFKMTAIDEAQNESEYSNTVSCWVYDSEDWTTNYYCTRDDMYIDGIALDSNNSRNGNILFTGGIYDDAGSVFDTAIFALIENPVSLIYNGPDFAMYISYVLYSINGFDNIVFYGEAVEIGDAYVQYRTYDINTATYGDWSTAISAAGLTTMPIVDNDHYIQIRIWIDTADWTNESNIKIIKINEVS